MTVSDIDPIRERSCRSCHGETAPMGTLDLSTRESLLRGGAAIVVSDR